MSQRGWFGLHPTIFKIASTHLVVDAYTNIYAPLLPLLIPQMRLSLATAGTLAMCFQMANSVAQLGFGTLADRWRPRALVLGGPLLAVIVLSGVGLATSPFTLGAILVLGGLGGAAFHPPAAALVYKLADHRKGLAMSAHISGGSLGFSLAPLLFAPFIARMGLGWSPLIMIPGLIALSWTLRQVPPMALPPAHERSTWASLRPAAGAARAPLLHDRAAHGDVLRLHDVRAHAADAAGADDWRGQHRPCRSTCSRAASAASWAGPLSDRLGPRRVILWTLVSSIPFLVVAPSLGPIGFTAMLAIGGLLLQSTLPISVTFAQTLRQGRRGDRVVAHDGVRLGHGQPGGAAHRRGRPIATASRPRSRCSPSSRCSRRRWRTRFRRDSTSSTGSTGS